MRGRQNPDPCTKVGPQPDVGHEQPHFFCTFLFQHFPFIAFRVHLLFLSTQPMGGGAVTPGGMYGEDGGGGGLGDGGGLGCSESQYPYVLTHWIMSVGHGPCFGRHVPTPASTLWQP